MIPFVKGENLKTLAQSVQAEFPGFLEKNKKHFRKVSVVTTGFINDDFVNQVIEYNRKMD